MRCSHCAQELEPHTTRCPRCGADLSSRALVRNTLVSVLYAAIAIALVALLTYIVLHWHDEQNWDVTQPHEGVIQIFALPMRAEDV